MLALCFGLYKASIGFLKGLRKADVVWNQDA